MASQTEKPLEKKFRLMVEKTEGMHMIPKSHPMGVKGILDRYVCVNGHFVGLEFKASKVAHRDPMQEYEVKAIKKAGGYAAFVYPENYQEIFNDLLKML
jgi:hypothetical protein